MVECECGGGGGGGGGGEEIISWRLLTILGVEYSTDRRNQLPGFLQAGSNWAAGGASR